MIIPGVPGKLKKIYTDTQALLTRWSSTLAGRVDVAISSRAAAASALLNTVWTDAKAALLDVAISTRAKSRTVQRGTITLADGEYTATATITAVTTGKASLTPLGAYPTNSSGAADPVYWAVRVELTNSTTVTARRMASGAVGIVSVGWEVESE